MYARQQLSRNFFYFGLGIYFCDVKAWASAERLGQELEMKLPNFLREPP